MPDEEEAALLGSAVPEEIAQILVLEARAGVRFTELIEQDPNFATLMVPDDLTPREELSQAILSGLCWVARGTEELVGFVYASVVKDYLFVEELDVLPEHGRRGLGKDLLRRVERRGLELGVAGLALTTFREVPWNAPWYRRLGFRDQEPDGAMKELRAVLLTEQERGFRLDQRVLMIREF